MISFLFHDGFESEIAALEKKRMRHIRKSLEGFQRLCEFHFHHTAPQPRIAPGKIHRVTQNEVWTMWKTELSVIHSGLRPNQYPRIWFAQSGATIAFLCIGSHIDNYRDGDMDALALSRVSDLF
ncbi:hypothetical protein COU77_02420 [Candidatus Peregrinibacteria bacterium CG10_big_fil_rev_8_21_14_0_10_49_16]|nr:MAG: hypothetical protein COW95_00905 [Candidatus Peregrinibacteria bacterium CG22_combo_CG10-13_8_21_14_all_49_11]PIR52064.1 MAG: hypothetical protein COU77_02420 [Candidatus Peregrinibacteria bacterium CG10_big_fil_rev_8_21_14_0_10_49_16]